MKHLILILSFLAVLPIFAQKVPRLRFRIKDPVRYQFSKEENYTMFFHEEGTDVIFVGGREVIYVLQFKDSKVSATEVNVEVDENAKKVCLSKSNVLQTECENFITTIQPLENDHIVCGTHATAPKCWMLVNETNLSDTVAQQLNPKDISPSFPSQRSFTLSADGNFYSALSMARNFSGTIRRSLGNKKQVKTEVKWLQNPQFAGAAVIPGKEKYKEEIYVFFTELNKTSTMDENPYRARIGRICMVDEGGIRGTLQDSWTTFLKARVMCGFPSTLRQFNQFKEAYVLNSNTKREGIIYGIFSNAWDSTVVCAYSLSDIDQTFRTSRLKGYTTALPQQRPGMCVFKNVTSSYTAKVLGIIRDYSEIEDIINPSGMQPLNLPQVERYTKIVADRVRASDETYYNVLYLGTEKGKIYKVMHSDDEVFTIGQYSVFRYEAPVTAMTIDTITGYLYVGTTLEVQQLPLANCSSYGDTCRRCVLARDPYCGWDLVNHKCSAIPEGYNFSSGEFLQNLLQSNAPVCEEVTDPKVHNMLPKEVTLDLGSYISLPCPVYSYHATYVWEKDNCQKRYHCIINGDSCPLIDTEDFPMKDGVYRCTAQEEGQKEEMVSYRLVFSDAPAGLLSAQMIVLVSSFALSGTLLLM
ncbi:semaphorin-7A [Polypterus senegalus]|uniref:semaphorin-7A n=1 Tax=Polypterus senegalus TaxID=55291 RepID=UPI001964C881|nr:semaphorin-7A [Polypterus senegalus]